MRVGIFKSVKAAKLQEAIIFFSCENLQESQKSIIFAANILLT